MSRTKQNTAYKVKVDNLSTTENNVVEEGAVMIKNKRLTYHSGNKERQLPNGTVDIITSLPVLLDDSNELIEVRAGGTITLPTAIGIESKEYKIKNTSLSTVTISASGSETIDGGASASLTTQYESITLISNGANWLIF